ncbi:MAG: MopE-related protein [Myxococcota bacterium]|nr:MopE-related protein [Myxococcota bacterium]
MYFLLWLFACEITPFPNEQAKDYLENQAADFDGDGFTENMGDCDDVEDNIYPGANEVCDGRDNDCDGQIDEDSIDASIWYEDKDSDGYGADAYDALSCDRPEGYVEVAGDCDDEDPEVNPNAPEVCDTKDNDCDGYIDDMDSLWVSGSDNIFYGDGDGDGFGNSGTVIEACSAPAGMVSNYLDCDDSNRYVNPNAIEVCDGVDNDCNNLTDDQDPDVELSTGTKAFNDSDGDGYGNADVSQFFCDISTGWVEDNTDCDDSNSELNPGMTEYCDGIDNNCNSIVDSDAVDQNDLYLDSDSDGYGDPNTSITICGFQSGYVLDNTDCNDSVALQYLGATEICDGIDNNCDGVLPFDEIDGDGDGYVRCHIDSSGWTGTEITGGDDCNDGDPSATPADLDGDGYSTCTGDCDDGNPTIFSTATELCDGLDNDCNGFLWIEEIDNDNDLYVSCEVNPADWFGSPIMGGEDCDDTSELLSSADVDLDGFSSCEGDCDDSTPYVSPAVSELLLDGVLQSCIPSEEGLLVVGSSNNCHLSETGVLNCWGDNSEGQLNFPSQPYSQVALSDKQICVLNTSGALSCYGSNAETIDFEDSYVGLSGGATSLCAISAASHQLQCTSPLDSNLPIGQFVQVQNGTHGCAIDINGHVQCWGDNSHSQSNPPTTPFKKIDVGAAHSCAIKVSGQIECWGDNSLGQSNPPAGQFTDISLGAYHSCAIDVLGEIHCWGENGQGESSPPAGSHTQLSLSDGHGCAISTQGTLNCWGQHDSLTVTDNDGDGSDKLMDCDDERTDLNALDLDGDGITSCDGDCDDNDPSIGYTDQDGDGYPCPLDCNDFNANLNFDDADQDGYTSCDDDCDDNDPNMFPIDADNDGYTVCEGDCADDDPSITPRDDFDGDGFEYCFDCDDQDDATYPGAAIRDSVTDCMRDLDGDGWGEDISSSCCYLLQLQDSFGNGWDGASLAVFIDGQLFERYDIGFGSEESYNICVPEPGTLSLEYTGGAWDSENSYQLYSPIENDLLFSDGPNPVDGLAFSYAIDFEVYDDPLCAMRTMVVSGSDCNDSDPTVGGFDLDQDGFSACSGDCDDNNPDLTDLDSDGDGYSSCDGDCDDSDPLDMSDFDNDGYSACQGDCDNYDRWTYKNALEDINDGVDQSCDGVDLEAKVVASENATCAIDIFGELSCWGTGDIIGNVPSGTYVDVSLQHSAACAINSFGQISCWGIGNNDLCGAQDSMTASNYMQLSVFSDQLCALRSNGQMTCEGCATPNSSAGLSAMDILQISGGNNGYACGLTAEHTVSCLSAIPPAWEGFAEHLTQIRTYNHRVCGITLDGSIECDGANSLILSNIPEGEFKQIGLGIEHACALDTDNSVQCWGGNSAEQLNVPMVKAKALTVGDYHSCILTEYDTIECWGSNESGQLNVPSEICMSLADNDGDGFLVCDGDCDDSDPSLNPLDLDGDGYTTCNGDCDDNNAALTGLDVDGDGASASCDLDFNDFDSSVETLDIDGDGFTTCDGDCNDFDPILNLLDADGDGYTTCQGDCNDADFSIRPFAAELVNDGIDQDCDGEDKTQQIAHSIGTPYLYGFDVYDFACGLDAKSELKCWGEDSFGQVSGRPTVKLSLISLGSGHGCGLDDEGSIHCWGRNNHGQSSPPQGRYIDLDLGINHSCAMDAVGDIHCWGQVYDHSVPYTEGPFTQFKTSLGVTCALGTDRLLECWGLGDFLVTLDHPTQTQFKTIDSGYLTFCGLDEADEISCWETQASWVNAPWVTNNAQLPSGTFKDIAVGGADICAIDHQNALTCWGNSAISSNRPTDIEFKELSLSAEVNFDHDSNIYFFHQACGVDTEGQIHCWGDNTDSPAEWCEAFTDNDNDGYSIECDLDCDDNDPELNTADYDGDGLTTCDGDCIDFDALTGVTDSDGDGYSDCFDIDCDISNPLIRPNAKDLVFDGIDQDCDGEDNVATVDVGHGQTCVINTFGEAICQGKTSGGIVHETPDTDFTSISVGYTSTCGLDIVGGIHCWNESQNIVAFTPQNTGYTDVQVGNGFACALNTDRQIECWGDHASSLTLPTETLFDYSVNESNACGITDNGQINCWANHNLPSPPLGSFIDVEVGGEHACALDTDHNIQCWGNDNNGQVNGPSGYYKSISLGFETTCGLNWFNQIECFGDIEPPSGHFTQLSLYSAHGCAIDTDNELRCFGTPTASSSGGGDALIEDWDNDGSTLTNDCNDSHPYYTTTDLDGDGFSPCDGDRDDQDPDISPADLDGDGVGSADGDCNDLDAAITPIDADADGFSSVCDNDCDDNNPLIHAFAIDGVDDGLNSSCSREISLQVAVGADHICAISDGFTEGSGETICWGDDTYGQTTPPNDRHIHVVSGDGFSCGIAYDSNATLGHGPISCWGRNSSNIVNDAPSGAFFAIAAGADHVCAIEEGGVLTCWGDDSFGQVSGAPSNDTFVQLSLASEHSCGLNTNAQVRCWGENNGFENTTPPLSRFARIETSDTHSCALSADGQAHCWGSDADGESTPPLSTFVDLSLGNQRSCGITENGNVRCWGYEIAFETGEYTHISQYGDAFCAVEAGNGLLCSGTYSTGDVVITDQDEDGDNVLIDCDDLDEFLTVADTDFDGVTTCDGDCDDLDPLDMLDKDGDGYTHCDLDCDDDDGSKNPHDSDGDGWSTCQGDCDDTDTTVTTIDQDGDGFSDCFVDCDPTNYSVHPAAQELVGDGIDNNCDGIIGQSAYVFDTSTSGHIGSCVIREDQTMDCYHTYNPDVSIRNTPIIAVDMHKSSYCWLDSAGTVQCQGVLGNLSQTITGQVQIAVGSNHGCALDSQGTVTCWGFNDKGQISPIPNNGSYVQIAAGNDISCGLQNTGAVTCWGGYYYTPVISGDFISVATGNANTVCALKKDSTIMCDSSVYSYDMTEFPPHPYKSLDFSSDEICLRRLSNQARCWSDGYTSRPKLFAIEPTIEEFQSVQGSYRGQCGLKLDGEVMCWNTTELSSDLDNDGFNVMVDCDDKDATIGASVNGACP